MFTKEERTTLMTIESSTMETTKTVEQMPAANISVDNAPSAQSTPDATPDSSTGKTEVAKPESTLDLVKKALADTPKDKVEPAASTTAEAKADDAQPPKDGNAATAEGSDEDDKKLPFHNHPRWKEVIAENKELKTKAAEFEVLQQQVTEFKQKADSFDVIANYAEQNNLEGSEVDLGFQVMAAIKSATQFGGDPKIALDILVPIVEQLQSIGGLVLPDDLKQKVDDGYIDAETAAELAALRAGNARSQKQVQHATSTVEQIRQNQQKQTQEQLNSQIQSEVASWEGNWKKTDPEYSIKQPYVEAEIYKLMAQHGKPQTPDDAVHLANVALKNVNERMKQLAPKREEIKTVTGGVKNSSPAAVINSTQDAVRAALSGNYQMKSPSVIS